ncbi:MAG TPA: hypothetical protein VFG35_07850 [Actinoplanes sp.]|nr:hypothetical protein [Actinoplanes sp.]
MADYHPVVVSPVPAQRFEVCDVPSERVFRCVVGAAAAALVEAVDGRQRFELDHPHATTLRKGDPPKKMTLRKRRHYGKTGAGPAAG